MTEFIIFTFVILTFLILVATIVRLRRVEKILASHSLLNAHVKFLLKNTGVTFDPFDGLPKELADALRGSETKIEAIKRYRENTKIDLKEAKLAVEAAIEKSGISL